MGQVAWCTLALKRCLTISSVCFVLVAMVICCSCLPADNMDDVDSGTEVDPTDSQPSKLKVCVCVCVKREKLI